MADFCHSFNGRMVTIAEPITISFQDKFTNIFIAQDFSVFTPGHSGLVLTLGVTDHFLGHRFQLDALIQSCMAKKPGDCQAGVGLERVRNLRSGVVA